MPRRPHDDPSSAAERDERSRLRHIVEALPAMVAYWDAEHRNRYANQAYEAWFAVPPGGLRGRVMREVFDPGVYELNLPHVLAALRGEPQEFERHFPDRGGGGPPRRAQVHYLPHVEGGEVLGFAVLVFDVTERRREAAARLEVEARLRSIGESLGEALVSLDADGRVLTWNRGAEQTFGFSAAEMIGRALETLMPARAEPDGGWVRALGGDAAGGGATAQVLGRRRDGEEFPLEVSLTPWSTPDGRFFTGLLRDMSERRQGERARRASEERFRALSRHAPVGIFETDARGGLLFANGHWAALSGMTAAQSAGDGWVESIHPDDRALVLREWAASCAEEREFRVEHRLRSAEGEVWVVCSAAALRGEAGEVTGYLGTVMDITASKRAERVLREALLQKEALLREIHHRVKNNLQVISSLLRLQARGIDDPVALAAFTESEGRVRSIALLHESLYRATDLARVHMDDYLRGLTTDLQRTYGAPGVRFSIDACGVALDIDAAVPSGLIVNELVTNALKHAFPSGSGCVEVRMRREGARVELSVSDDGVGLDRELDPDDRKTLGLRLVRTLARQLKADFALERGPGTRARITFEAAADGEVAPT